MPTCKDCQSDLSADAIVCLNCGAATGLISAKTATRETHQQMPAAPKETGAVQQPKMTASPHAAAFPTPPLVRHKSKVAAGILAFLLGSFGAHHFYLGTWGWGVIHIGNFIVLIALAAAKANDNVGAAFAFIWMVFAMISLVRAILFLCANQAAFDQKYNHAKPSPFTW